jgi:hypothetical protein
MWEVETQCGHSVTLSVALKTSTDKPLICEACFVKAKRIAKTGFKGYRRFRYLVPANELQRIPLRGEVK